MGRAPHRDPRGFTYGIFFKAAEAHPGSAIALHFDEFYALHPEYKPKLLPLLFPRSTQKSPPKTPASTVQSLPRRRAKSSRMNSGTRGGGWEEKKQPPRRQEPPRILCAKDDSLDAALKRREVEDSVQPRR